MTNSKLTKRALLSSVMALILCFTMLLGTTFAWFTDTASTSVNKIEAGTLDVQLLDSNDNSLEGKTLSWQKAAGHENEDVLWEPGCTYSLQPITIKNNGSLALKYKIAITGILGSAKLNEVIEWTIKVGETTYSADSEFHLTADASNTLTISGHMQESAGNEYQGEKIEGIAITVYATQDTVESDSKDNKYDANATYMTVTADVDLSTTTDIEAAIKDAIDTANKKPVSTNVIINLKNDTGATKDVTINYWTSLADAKNLTLNLDDGVVFSVSNIAVREGQTFTVTGEGTIKNGYWPVYSGGTLILENEGGFAQENMGNAMINIAKHGANVVIKDYELKNNTTSNHPLIEIGSMPKLDVEGYTTASKLTLENVAMDGTVHFSNGSTTQSSGIYVYDGSIDIITKNVTFNGSTNLTVSFKGKLVDAFLSINSSSSASATLNGVKQTNQ